MIFNLKIKLRHLRIIASVLVLIYSFKLNAQDQLALDSLSWQRYSKSISIKVNALNELCRIYTGTDNDKAMDFAKKAVQLSKASKNKALLAQSLNRLGTIYDYREIIDSANTQFLAALNLFEKLKDKSGIAAVYQNIGVMYYFQNDLEKAIDYYNKAIVLRKQTNELDFVAKLQNNLAIIFRQQKKHDQAISLYRESLALKLKFNDNEAIANAYSNLATAYSYKEVYDSAKLNLEKAIKINSKIKSQINLAGNYLQLAEIHYSERNLSETKSNILKSIGYANEAESNSLLYNAYVLMWNLDTTMHNYKSATENQLIAAGLNAKIFDEEKARAVEKLNVLYESEKKDKKIITLNAEQNKKRIENRNLTFGLFGLLFLLVIGTLFYRKLRHKNTLLSAQKAEIINKTEELNKQAAEIAKHQSQMNPHFIFNALVSVQNFILRENKEKAADYLSQLSKLMRLTLYNSEKDFITLKEEKYFLESYIAFEKFRFENVFSSQFDIDESVDPENTLIPPMIIQPFIENAVKHGLSPAKSGGELQISMYRKNLQLFIEIKDNGIGRKNAELLNEMPEDYQSKGIDITVNRIKTCNQQKGFALDSCFEIVDLFDDKAVSTGTLIKIALPFIEIF